MDPADIPAFVMNQIVVESVSWRGSEVDDRQVEFAEFYRCGGLAEEWQAGDGLVEPVPQPGAREEIDQTLAFDSHGLVDRDQAVVFVDDYWVSSSAARWALRFKTISLTRAWKRSDSFWLSAACSNRAYWSMISSILS